MNLIDLICLALIVAIPLGLLLAHWASREEQQPFPIASPISDDEFMARLPPGTNREIALKVRRIVADQFGVDYERVHPDCTWSDLGAD